MKAFHLLLRITLGGAMLYAGALKALDPAAFAASLANYQLFPAFLLAPLATLLPWLELVVGAALLTRRFPAGAAAWCTVLGAGFVTALGTAWLRGINLDCGCFGTSAAAGEGSLALALARAGLILAAAATLLRLEMKVGSGPGPR
ncbi:MAG: MauE/DoxX family redox-associated membrane protein [Verrucomicrobiota bacterium]|jgi:hypothetical protein